MSHPADNGTATDIPEGPTSFSARLPGVSTGILSDLLDFIFPPECIVCEKRLSGKEAYYCEACRAVADDIHHPICPGCRNGVAEVHAGCKSCKGCNPISMLWTCGSFDQFYRPVVHGIKYQGLLPLAIAMAEILASRIGEFSDRRIFDFIVPVPLHWTRRRQRGFNQSSVVAYELAKRLHLPVVTDVLKRVKRTLDQTGLSAEERVWNMHGAFTARTTEAIAGKRALLIDDVTTTGATLNEAARELRAAGCKNVFAAVIAIASYG